MTPERAKELLIYDPDTGIFLWRVDRTGTARRGTPAGRVGGGGYFQISLDGVRYCSHRIAWLIQHGAWPPNELDHINGNKADNRIVNLRPVTRDENVKNRPSYKRTKSVHPGVLQRWGKWHVRIQNTHLGTFQTLDAAMAARLSAEAARGFHPNHGRAQ